MTPAEILFAANEYQQIVNGFAIFGAVMALLLMAAGVVYILEEIF